MKPAHRESPATRTLYSCNESQTAYPMGYAATIAMSNSDGDTIRAARRRSGMPLERFLCGEPALMEAASIGLWLP